MSDHARAQQIVDVQCPDDTPITIRRGADVILQTDVLPLSKGVRTGSRLGRSVYFPSDFYEGKLGELLVYKRSLDESEIARVTTYLAGRWPRL